MKWLVRTILFIGLSVVLLFALNANKSMGHAIEIEKSTANKIKTLFIRYANQDINRCEMVSLLLFPYHSFW